MYIYIAYMAQWIICDSVTNPSCDIIFSHCDMKRLTGGKKNISHLMTIKGSSLTLPNV